MILPAVQCSPGHDGRREAGTDSPNRNEGDLPYTERFSNELLPNEFRLVSVHRSHDPSLPLRRGDLIFVACELEVLSGIQQRQGELLVSLGPIDVARAPFDFSDSSIGEMTRLTTGVYVPRYAPDGILSLRMGIVRDGAPGESRSYLCNTMVYAGEVKVAGHRSIEAEALQENETRVNDNLLVNGSFEKPSPRTGMQGTAGFEGWEVEELAVTGTDGWRRALNIALDDATSTVGTQSLRIAFGGGQDPDFWHVYQEVDAKPETDYILSFHMLTEKLTGASPPHFTATPQGDGVGTGHETGLPRAYRQTGTTGWELVEIPFTTPENTESLLIRLRRFGSGMGRYWPDQYGPIQGTVWFDGLHLTEQNRNDG